MNRKAKVRTLEAMTCQEVDGLVEATAAEMIDDDALWTACHIFLTFEWGTEEQKAKYAGNWRRWADRILSKAEHEGHIDVSGILDCIMDNNGWGR